MPSLQQILADKGSRIHTIPPKATVLEATQLMNDKQIGALVVMEAGRVLGIFSERDVLRRVVAKELPPAKVTVEQVMTADVVCAPAEMDLDDASRVMRDRRIRHLPVCKEDGTLLGMISIGDINAHHASAQESQIHFLHEYVYGRV